MRFLQLTANVQDERQAQPEHQRPAKSTGERTTGPEGPEAGTEGQESTFPRVLNLIVCGELSQQRE